MVSIYISVYSSIGAPFLLNQFVNALFIPTVIQAIVYVPPAPAVLVIDVHHW